MVEIRLLIDDLLSMLLLLVFLSLLYNIKIRPKKFLNFLGEFFSEGYIFLIRYDNRLIIISIKNNSAFISSSLRKNSKPLISRAMIFFWNWFLEMLEIHPRVMLRLFQHLKIISFRKWEFFHSLHLSKPQKNQKHSIQIQTTG